MFFSCLSGADAPLMARAVASVLVESGGLLTPVQDHWLRVVFERLLNFRWDPQALGSIAPVAIRQQWPDHGRRLELIELLASLEMLCNPIPQGLHQAVNHWAAALMIESESLTVLRELAQHHQHRATRAWYRLSWFGQHAMANPKQMEELAAHGVMAIALTFEANPQEAARWRALKHCPNRSLGQALFTLLDQNGVGFPGEVGATHPTLALHDWIHVITNLPVNPLGEIATAAYIAAASRSSEATLAFLGTISIFEASLLDYHLGLSDSDCPPQLQRFSGALSQPGAIEVVTEAIKAGRRCPLDPLKDVDYFAVADQDLGQIRLQWLLPEQGLLSVPGEE